MKKFVDWFEKERSTDLVLKAGMAHLWFVTSHPFEDGNGRIARAIADMVLARSERSPQRFYSMSAQIRQERGEYYEILEATQRGDLDITDWLEWFLACLARAFDRAETILAAVLSKAHFWDRFAGTDFNERQRSMITRLLNGFEGKLTSFKMGRAREVFAGHRVARHRGSHQQACLNEGFSRWTEHVLFARENPLNK
jgi:Fic family protein